MSTPAPRRGVLALTTGLALLAGLTACGSTDSSPAASSTSAGSTLASNAAPGSAAVPTGQGPVPIEKNPPGDIPDNLAFVPYRNAAAGYSFTYPEGWARTENGSRVDLTDKLNGITADVLGVPNPLTVDAVKQGLSALQQSEPAFEFRTVSTVSLPAGSGVRLVYRRNSAPDPVTGRMIRDEVESYLIAKDGSQIRLDLYGPVGADNVDAYRTITTSLRFP